MKKPLSRPSEIVLRILPLWFALMAVQSAARLIFLLRFHDRSADELLPGETLRVLLLALRLDCSVASALSLLVAVATFLVLKLKLPESFRKMSAAHIDAVLIFLTLVFATVSLSYFEYYDDHFNVFFWEFWQDTENAWLVATSLPSSISLWWFAGTLAALSAAALVAWTIAKRIVETSFAHRVLAQQSFAFLVFLLLLLGCRATFAKPLPYQLSRSQVSHNTFLNQMHLNAFYAFDAARVERDSLQGKRRGDSSRSDRTTALDSAQTVQLLDGSGRVFDEAGNSVRLQYRLPGLSSKWLLRRPKHIVVLFMESLSEWPLQISDSNLNRTIGANFLEMRRHSYSFRRYTFPGAGTLSNILKANLGIPLAKNFPPETSFSEAFRSMPTSMPHAMASEGFATRFFFAGSSRWHNLAYFMKRIGYHKVYTESDCLSAERHTFGVHDSSLFELLDAQMTVATAPTFNFVMTISNHPPYQIPANWKPKEPITFPDRFSDQLIDMDLFNERMRAFAFADAALGTLMERAKQHGWLSDTLFFVTGDHSFSSGRHAGFTIPQFADSLDEKIVPAIVFAPDLMAKPPQEFLAPGSHIDILPTLLSLLHDDNRTITSFGRSLFQENSLVESWYGSNFICLNGYCDIGASSFAQTDVSKLAPCKTPACYEKAGTARKLRTALDTLGEHFFFESN